MTENRFNFGIECDIDEDTIDEMIKDLFDFEKYRCEDGKFRIVYLTTNLINNKVYVGQHTSKELKDNYLGSGKYLLRAVKKSGKENFKLGHLDYASNKAELDEKEIFWIKFFRDQGRLELYNIADGGGGVGKEGLIRSAKTRRERLASGEIVIWNKGKSGIYSKEQRHRMSENAKKQERSAESNKKRSDKLKGRVVTKETLEKTRKTRLENPRIISQEFRDKVREQMIKQSKTKIECPHCGKSLSEFNAKYWHFDNCKENPNYSKLNNEEMCPHCNFLSRNKAMMKRWHFDNCKHKKNEQ